MEILKEQPKCMLKWIFLSLKIRLFYFIEAANY